ncbi:MAG: NUDIX domain-containing protein [Candidatus Shapirobacteria bacterium]
MNSPYTWIPTDDIKKFQPITQVYGVCLNAKNEALICREPGKTNWGLPGGTPEGEESPIETLEREFMEEVDVKLTQIEPIGVQKVTIPESPIYYQARFYCRVKKILPQTLDPDTGLLYERQFVPILELNKYLNWGAIGDAIVKRTMEINQHPRLEKIHQTLVFIAQKLNSINVPWILSSSGALMIHGIDIVPWDLDILTTPENFGKIAKEFEKFIVSTEADWLKLQINVIEVEVLAIKDLSTPATILFQNIPIPVNSLQTELHFYQNRPGKAQTVKLIKEKLSQ